MNKLKGKSNYRQHLDGRWSVWLVQDGVTRSLIHTFAFTTALLLTAAPNMTLAKRGGDDDLRTAYYGIVQARPESGLHGEWVIGGRTFAADARTKFDQSEGKLVIGSCAKVQVRDGRVHEIDNEPLQDCQ